MRCGGIQVAQQLAAPGADVDDAVGAQPVGPGPQRLGEDRPGAAVRGGEEVTGGAVGAPVEAVARRRAPAPRPRATAPVRTPAPSCPPSAPRAAGPSGRTGEVASCAVSDTTDRGDRPPRFRVGVVGAGRVGTVLGAALHRAGHRVVAVAAVSEASLARAADC